MSLTRPRFVGRLGLADAVTAANAAVGFCAAVAATVDPGLAARVVLLAAVADALDGIVARWRGGTPAGEYLDGLADVASFGVAPAMIVVLRAIDAFGSEDARVGVAVAVGAAYVAVAVVRLGLYAAYDGDGRTTEGVPTTLAATLVAAAFLAGLTDPGLVVGFAAALTLLMLAPVEYPDLLARDAVLVGAVQALAILAPAVWDGLFPRALFAWALAYLLLAPAFYWR